MQKPVQPKVTFCLDAGGSMGWGHAMRCHVLANELKMLGNPIELITTSKNFGWPTHFPEFGKPNIINDWNQLTLTNEGIGILDHKELVADSEYLNRWATLFEKSVVIDDECNPMPPNLDLVVNPNVYAKDTDYPAVPSMTGADFTLIRSSFAEPQPIPELRDIPGPYIPIILGGNDAHNIRDKLIEFLIPMAQSLPMIVFVSSKAPTTEKAFQGIDRSLNAAELSYLFKKSSFAITALGGTAYELAYCQTPFIGICLNKNQHRLGQLVANDWGMPTIDIQNLNTTALKHAAQKVESAKFENTTKYLPKLSGKTRIAEHIASL